MNILVPISRDTYRRTKIQDNQVPAILARLFVLVSNIGVIIHL